MTLGFSYLNDTPKLVHRSTYQKQKTYKTVFHRKRSTGRNKQQVKKSQISHN